MEQGSSIRAYAQQLRYGIGEHHWLICSALACFAHGWRTVEHLPVMQPESLCVQHLSKFLSMRRLRAGVPKQVPGMPLSDVLLVNVKMLTLSELSFLSGKARCRMLYP